MPLILTLLGCGPESVSVPSPEAGAGWQAEVEARLADAGHTFFADGEGWVGRSVESGLGARFDPDGVELDGGIRLGTAGVPALGACVDGMEGPDGVCVRRLEYAGDDAVEWWVVRADGLEQGWTVATPTGDRELRIEVPVAGAEVVVTADEVRLLGDTGRWIGVSGLVAIDANGRPLPAHFSASPTGFAVVVDDAGAEYPIEVDPIYETADWAFYGQVRNAPYASAVTGAGDVNGDGYDDVLIGAYGYNSYTGAAYLFAGSAAGLSTPATTTLTGTTRLGNFGRSVAGVGDVNGDGYDDVLIGEPSSTGHAWLYLGSADGLEETAAWSAVGGAGGYYGNGLAGGDIDGDGYADIAVGEPNYATNAGRVYIYAGSPTGPSTTAVTTIDGAALEYFGGGLASGDANGDGFADLVVSSSGYNSSTGRVWIHEGSATGLSTTSALTLTGSSRYAGLGAGIALADVDADGFDDLVVGASLQYKLYVYPGSATGVVSTATTIPNPGSANAFASRVATADVNADGYQDAIVGAYLHSSTYIGRAYVFHGGASGLAATPTTTITGTARWDQLGYALANAGDVNGDGYEDVVIGAPGQGTNPGYAQIHLGSVGGISSAADTTIEGSTGEYLGAALAAGDIDRDGYDDVVVGAPETDGQTGRIDVFYGTAAGLPDTPDLSISGISSGTWFGSALAVTDLGGDGYADVAVGAPTGTTPRVYVFDGSAAGLAWSPSTAINAPSTGSNNFGGTVAAAGDVNADGAGDLLVSATSFDSSGTDVGAVYVYLGTATGVATSPATTIVGTTAYEYLGSAIASAGDVNRDGYDDILIGAQNRVSYQGQAYLHIGSSSGISSVPTVTMQGDGTTERFGATVAGVGDLDGDGYDDVAVAATYNSSSAGRVYVFPGGPTGLPMTTSTQLTSSAANTQFGQTLAGAGDVDADGYADLVVGNGLGGTSPGTPEVTLYLGGSGGVGTTAEVTMTGAVGSTFGDTVASAGDVDADGYDDVLVGGYYYESGGAAWLYRGYADADGDGVAATEDCDDTDPTVGEAASLWADTDGDGYGDAAVVITACSTPGWVDDDTDCDDTRGDVSPGGIEVCDGVDDEDCDSLVDDDDPDVTLTTPWFVDRDGDGYGSGASTQACLAPAGMVADAPDCDDADAATFPGAPEVTGDEVDQDCDGAEDCYEDADGDGARGDTIVVSADVDCDGPGEAASTADLDCDDTDPDAWPGAAEVVGDGVDQDCDGGETCYADADGDGARVDSEVVSTHLGCDEPGEALATAVSDCDDADASVFPGATEGEGDGVDQDCDGGETCYVDADGDGARTVLTVTSSDPACDDAGEALSTAALDCDDTDAAISPDAAEIAGDEVDQDCDGGEVCYVDADGDGARATSEMVSADTTCDGAGEALTGAALDCDDTDASVFPGATEGEGDGVDQDCDGGEECYVDADGDGARTSVAVASTDLTCGGSGEALSSAALDCDDTDAAVSPAASEVAGDGVDQDCDGADLCYVDADGDGFRTDTPVVGTLACDAAGEASASVPADDCDDAAADIRPGATETIGDGVDQDCDGGEICYADADLDGWTAGVELPSADADCTDAGEAADGAPSGDCDDADAARNPGASEPDCADPVDYNCDGSTGYADADADGFAACQDCDDADPAAWPGAPEVAGDGLDEDCDGAEACYVDADADGHRTTDEATVVGTSLTCDGPGEAAASLPPDDCDDADPAAWPGAVEVVGDGVDEDCDGLEICYVDADADGWTTGDEISAADLDCTDAGEAGAGAPDGDCDDADAARNPAATETDCLDPVDYNCDGSTGYADADADGFAACEECDDDDAASFPGATEAAGDGVDQDCDGVDLCYVDADGDGWRTESTAVGTGLACDGPGEADSSLPSADCDDGDGAIFPGATEAVGDEVDSDCDGTEQCFTDSDGDGWRTDTTRTSADVECDAEGEAADDLAGGDCDDADPDTWPGAIEIAGDGVDQDCDGSDPAIAETGETGEAGETGETGETGEESGVPAETADSDKPGDTGGGDEPGVVDTARTPPDPASACGCGTEGGWAGAPWLVGAALMVRRRRVPAAR